MTRDDILKMAREAKLLGEVNGWDVWYPDELERFAQLVAAAEREACAVIAEELFCGCGRGNCPKEDTRAQEIANAIRARGQQ